MAATTGQDYGIRKGLVSKGVSNSDIGYDKNTGYVTVKGANAIKAPKNYMGTSYTSQQGFNDDWSSYQKSQQQPNLGAVGNVVYGATNTAANTTPTQQPTPTTQTYNPYGTSNPYDTQVNDMIKMLMNQANNPQPVDVNAIYNSPQWASYQAQANKGAQQGIRAAQESMGSSGFGRSTALQERSQGIQNDANEYMNAQVLPQLMAQEQASRQQQLENQFGALDALLGQQTVGDNRFNSANNLAINKSGVTGSYLDPEASRLIDEITQLGESWKTGTAEQKTQYNQKANQNRALLSAMGIDPNLFGADKTTEERIANVGRAGVRTIQGQEMDWNKDPSNPANQEAEWRLKELQDPNSNTNRMAKLDLEMKEMEAANMPEETKLRLEQLRKTIAEIGSDPYRSPDQIRMDELNIQKAELEIEEIKKGDKPETAESLNSYIKGVAKYDTDGALTNPEAVEDTILLSNLSEYEMYRAYKSFGIPWAGPVPAATSGN